MTQIINIGQTTANSDADELKVGDCNHLGIQLWPEVNNPSLHISLNKVDDQETPLHEPIAKSSHHLMFR